MLSESRRPVSNLHLSILLISGVGIAYQVVLMRIFSIAQWHHFAYMIISIAMLGFGAGGTLLALVKERIRGREPQWLSAAAAVLSISLIVCYELSQWVPFETFLLVTQPRQIWWLFALYVILAAPFFLVSTCITLGFILVPTQIGRLYCINMVGSGLGAAIVVGLLYATHPANIPYWLAVPVATAYLLLVRSRRFGLIRGLALLTLSIGITLWGPRQHVRVSEYKGLSYALRFPDARVLDEKVSPLSVVTAVSSKQIRETPGQIANYPMSRMGELPEQVGLYFDAGAVTPVSRFDGRLERFAYMDYVTGALPYQLVEGPRVLLLGAGGGSEVLGALYHGAEHVTAVEVDPSVAALLQDNLREFSGGLYERPDVSLVIAEGRGFVDAHDSQYDVIVLPLAGSFNAAAAGVLALDETYLYTVEALTTYLDRLAPDGVLAITCWLKTPARDAIKLFATAVEACERTGIVDPSENLAFIRSWNNATILASRSPLAMPQIQAIQEFAHSRSLDLCYYPGITPKEVNRHTILEEPIYYESAMAVLSPDRERFYQDALFYVRPATDNQPYVFRFFKWAALPRLLKGMGTKWVPFVEWGYVTLAATLVQSILVSATFIILPLVVLVRRRTAPGAKRGVLVYFGALGAGYILLEIAFMQYFMRFMAYPIYAVAVVLTAFLVFSGLGSLCASSCAKNQERTVALAVLGIAGLAGLYLALLPGLFAAGAGWPDIVKILLSLALLAPLAFSMGFPFPLGMQRVSDRFEPLVPWAWGINGFASVIAATLATILAVHLGFRWVIALAVLVYILAAWSFYLQNKKSPSPEYHASPLETHAS